MALVAQGDEQAVANAIYEKYPKARSVWPEVYTTRASACARVELVGDRYGFDPVDL